MRPSLNEAVRWVVRFNTNVRTDRSSVRLFMPALLTNHGVFVPLVRYLVANWEKSPSWRNRVTHSVKLLMEYMIANHDQFDDVEDLFTSFAMRMSSGTISEEGDDPSGLHWWPRSRNSVLVSVKDVTLFSNFMVAKYDAQSINPPREATPQERRMMEAARRHAREKALLGHTWEAQLRSELLLTQPAAVKKPLRFEHDADEPAFPEEFFIPLLERGFRVGGKQSLRDVLITLLLHNGPRLSEVLHLFVHDVVPDPTRPDTALVRIYHPEEGLAPNDWLNEYGESITATRNEYLRGKYGMLPRTLAKPTTTAFVGWKGATLDSRDTKHFRVWFFPEYYGEVFWRLWEYYKIERAQIMLASGASHPFAFVTSNGTPVGTTLFRKSHERAVKRIGLEPGWGRGTTPHSHRHAYAMRLKGFVDPVIVQKLLRHRSISSQDAYTAPELTEVNAALTRAAASLAQGESLALPAPNLDELVARTASSPHTRRTRTRR